MIDFAKKRREKLTLALWIVAVFLLGLVASYLLFGGALQTNKSLWRSIANVFPVPVASVEGKSVRLSAVETAEKLNIENPLEFAVRQKSMEVLAGKLDLKIEDKEVVTRRNTLASAWGMNKEQLESQLSGKKITLAQFEKLIVIPEAYADKIKTSLNKPNEKLNEVKSRFDKNEDFNTLAKNYSEDSVTAPFGGDAGFVSKDILGDEIWDKVYALSDGQAIGPLNTHQGYLFVKRVELQQATDVNLERLHIQVILIKTFDFNSWLDDQMKQLDIKRYI